MTDEKKMEMLEARFLKNPKSILFARLADYYLQQNRVDEAVNLCKEGIKYHPYYITGNFILGKAYIAANEFEKAEEALKKVLAHDRQHLAAHELLAELMIKQGWENKAAVHYKEILKIDPLNHEVRQALSKLTGNEIEHEEPPPIVADTEEDLLSSKPELPSSDEKPWMKKLEEAFPKHFEEPPSETLPEPHEETTMESLISQAETLIEKNIKPQKSSESSDGIHEVEMEDVPDTDQTDQTIKQEEMEEPVSEEEESHKKPPLKEPEETVEERFEGTETVQGEQTIQDEKEVTEEEVLFEAPTSESDQDVEKSEEENIFEQTSREPEQAQTGEEEEVFFEPTIPDSEKTIAQIEEEGKIKEKDLSEVSTPEPALEKPQEKKEEPEEELFSEMDYSEAEEAPEKKDRKTGEPAASREEPTIETETKTEEAGFFIEVTEPESIEEEKTEESEPLEPEKSESEEKVPEEKLEEKEVPPPVEETPEEKKPEPESESKPEIKAEEPEAMKQESPPGNEKDKKKTKIMTPTLGEIYAAQGQFEKAIKVYENLLEKNPDNKQYQEKIEELKNKSKNAK
jgi:tetratricopeptide (TPR) repeat protein